MHSSTQRLLLSCFSGILLCLPWYEQFSSIFLLFAFVPLLILENSYSKNRTQNPFGLFWYSLLCFLIWNSVTTWWICYPTKAAVVIILTNSLLFASIFWLFHKSKKICGNTTGNFLLIIYWLSFEYLYLNAEISWPWLNLGNGFANSTKLVQWYEFTGTLGGTAWVWISNILIAAVIINRKNHHLNRWGIFIASFSIIVPVIISLTMYNCYKEVENPVKIKIIQPKIDPYHEKFGTLTPHDQLSIILNEASKNDTTAIDYFVAPETSITGNNDENSLNTNMAVKEIRKFLSSKSTSTFVIGAETYKDFQPNLSIPFTAQKYKGKDLWYDRYNSAIQIDVNTIDIYHKSKLALGVEKIPYLQYFQFFKKLSINLGGTSGYLGTQNFRGIFKKKTVKIAPVICYESAYGEFVNDFIKNGANLIFIITNDGWFGSETGPRQHLSYAKLRAVETRRSIARCANTGISAFINQRGDILQTLDWWKKGSLTNSLNLNNQQTFYVKHGDYLGKLACILTLFSLLLLLYIKFQKR